ncbi:hypothetical protein BT93_H1438 [Corymbia citriodora subsp. variegata]|nr:hypothetical protein BT93_H1438 [Corymbia citriodora subsp. variegata]
MSAETASSAGTVIASKFIHLTLNPDGTVDRSRMVIPVASASAAPDPTSPASPVLSKDVPINPSHNTWARIFLPQRVPSCSEEKLPLVVYYHGGGFILFSAASKEIHEFCVTLARELPAVVVSVEYRLAPEHRLPSAYDDAVEALHWIKTLQDEWLADHTDLSTCYLMGSSSGGNMAFHAGLRASMSHGDLEPLKIRGLILHHAYFGGTQRTPSELRLENDETVPLVVSDAMWELSLPLGATRDHVYSNPMADGGIELFEELEKMRSLGCRVLITGCDGDPLIDREVELAKMLQEKGVSVVTDFAEGGQHGIELREPDWCKLLVQTMKTFMATKTATGHGGVGLPDKISTQIVA